MAMKPNNTHTIVTKTSFPDLCTQAWRWDISFTLLSHAAHEVNPDRLTIPPDCFGGINRDMDMSLKSWRNDCLTADESRSFSPGMEV